MSDQVTITLSREDAEAVLHTIREMGYFREQNTRPVDVLMAALGRATTGEGVPAAAPGDALDAAVTEIAASQWDACEGDDGPYATAIKGMVRQVLTAYQAMTAARADAERGAR